MSRKPSDSPARRRGPKPLLSERQESQLVQWVIEQHSSKRRVSRDDVISQAQKVALQGETPDGAQEAKPSQTLGMGWCNRFMARHPELNLRSGGPTGAKKEVSATGDPILKFAVGGGMLPDASADQEEQSVQGPGTAGMEGKEAGEARGSAEPTKTRKYNRKHMEAAVEMYLAGRPMSEVTQRFPLLHQRTIRRRVLRVQRGEVDRRRGPRPLLEGEPEQELVAWILDMQSRGTRVTKQDILARANEQYRALTGGVAGENRLKEGWLRRFKERHPVLSGRAPASVRQGGDDSSPEEEKELDTGGDGELLSSTQSTGRPQELMPAAVEDENVCGSLQKRSEAAGSEADAAAAPKRQRTEEKASAAGSKATHSSSNTHRGSILPQRRQAERSENVRKLDAIMQSNERLEEMQRQQLEMLQQLCAANKGLPCLTGNKRDIGNTS